MADWRGESLGECAAAPAGNEWSAVSRDAAISMNLNAKIGAMRNSSAAWVAGLFLMLALCVSPLVRAPVSSRISHRRNARTRVAPGSASAISGSNIHSEVRNYFLNFAGDHSLDVATVIEQPSAGYTKYTVQLHLASGVEQSVVVSAPPGGLQVEMHDMTGDKVQNDVVLRPALVRSLPTVLVNDGHEHFEVAVAGTNPSSFSSSGDLGSRRRDRQTFALLMSSGFKAVHLRDNRRPFDPLLQECLFSSFAQTVTHRLGHASSSGRAPPLVTAI
ncbi:MAG TPA: hypothetical protein VGP19_11225 [Candidatus Acidoferrales bacterium]|jgi:hypothetical protein|nr:hypothetical protein [Candidatus Acidoferrales bacterium]